MRSESPVDPRYRSLEPTSEEIEAWANREHQRRAAWLAGPTEGEKQDWARRYRRRAAFGLEESRLAPTRQEVDEWAAREHKRREAWLAGPSEAEAQQWARQQRPARADQTAESPMPIAPEEIEAWRGREQQRRQEWLAGPSEEEKSEWARQQSGGILNDLTNLPGMVWDPEFSETAQRLMREVELAGKGTLYALSRVPKSLWSYFLRAGEAFEEEIYQKPRRTRIRF